MKYFFIFLLAATTTIKSIGQHTVNKKDSISCFEDLSYFWKLDSLGRNGFRLEVYQKLENCKEKNLTSENLLRILGKPNKITKDNLGSVYYQYIFLDGRNIPKQANYARSLMFIYFRFDKNKPYVAYVGDDHYD